MAASPEKKCHPMKAAVFQGVGKPLSIETVPDPAPASQEVIIKIGRCGICGTDLHMTDGHGMMYPIGTIPGHEFAGEVVALGSEVHGIKMGDRVAAQPLTGCGVCASCLAGEPKHCLHMVGIGSAFAQYTRAGYRECVKLPSSLSLSDGALIEPLAVGLHGVLVSKAGPGARILIIGAGPIGLAVAYSAKRVGAERIAVMARSKRHEKFAFQMGATHFLTVGDDPAAGAAEILGGTPDIVFECVGQSGMLNLAMNCVGRKGTVVVLGFCSVADSISPSDFLFKELKLIYSNTYSTREFEIIADALDSGAVEPRGIVTETVSLDDLPSMFESLRKPSAHCKVMVDPG
jgi:(R,R)-butanediol dehydrogenase/meso-butanediol dehydrogenase/diacetyl reductase